VCTTPLHSALGVSIQEAASVIKASDPGPHVSRVLELSCGLAEPVYVHLSADVDWEASIRAHFAALAAK